MSVDRTEPSGTAVEAGDPPGARRRTVIKRAALIGGATVWTTPMVQSIAAHALASGGSTAAGGTQPEQVTMEMYVVADPQGGSTPTRVCKTIAAKGATAQEREGNAAALRSVYCSQSFVDTIIAAMVDPTRYELPRPCLSSDVPTTC